MIDGREAVNISRRHLTPIPQADSGSLSPIAFSDAFVRFGPRITRGFLRRGLSKEDAEDMLQDTFLRFYSPRTRHEADADTTRATLNGIARKRFLAWRGGQHKTVSLEQMFLCDQNGNQMPKINPPALTTAVTPELEATSSESVGIINLTIDGLDPRYREVVRCFIEGYSRAEIAQKLKIPKRGSVSKRLMFGLSVLRKKLAKEGIEI